MVCFNWHYLFGTALYEQGDPALNSLSVLRAERFHEIYGAYSRWELHHPGPALFYLFGWCELLFYRWLHVMPTPFNAQVLGVIVLNTGFFGGALGVAARWVRSRYFLPLTLLLATLHFAAVTPRFCLTSTWPPFTMPMIFLALLVAAASVAAGQGDDLPLLVLAGGFAVHNNLAQPLFVTPLFAIGYLGFAWSCIRRGHASVAAGETAAFAPWRRFPRAHAVGGAVLLAFLLPLFADLCKGTQSNLYAIFHNLPHDPSKHRTWRTCLLYFLYFGAYRPSLPGVEYDFRGHANARLFHHFYLTHLRMMAVWLAVLLTPLLALAWRRPWRPAATGTDDPTAGRWPFLGWLAACWAVGVGLTLYWAHLIEAELAYYHCWFSYALWFVLLMIAAAAASDALETFARRARRPWAWPVAVAVLCTLGMAGTIFHYRGRFHEQEYDDHDSFAAAQSVKTALAAQRDGPHTKMLHFLQPAWGAAGGVALLLERLGFDSRVGFEWLTQFGPDHAPSDPLEGLTWRADDRPAFDVWRLVPANTHPAAAASLPLVDGFALLTTQPDIDPNPGQDITFCGARPDYDDFAASGWSPGAVNDPFVWSEGSLGMLCFQPHPIPAGRAVEVVIDAFPMLARGMRAAQRVDVDFNGHALGTLRFDAAAPDALPRVLIPGALWNRVSPAVLSLHFRDAISPWEFHESDDRRRMALGTRKITFRTVPAPVPTTAF